MSQHGWKDCPPETSTQVRRLVGEIEGLLAGNLLGIYLHGSLAMGCFNPRRSDLDFLVISRRPLPLETKERLAGLLLRESLSPHPIEISFLPREYLIPWQYPTRYDFHYSESWREKTLRELGNGTWMRWNDEVRTDHDLAAHITITRQRGVCLSGVPVDLVFPEVPAEDYLASIYNDIQESLDGNIDDPVYSILNLCRVYAYKRNGLVCSKQEGGLWALKVLPVEIQTVVRQALEIYADGTGSGDFDPQELADFIVHMRSYLSG